MTWIARLFPPPCIQLWASSDACLNLVTASEWNVNHSRRKEECSLCFSLCFFLALQHFHWVSRTGKECLARKGEKKCCQGQGTQPRDSIHQLHGGPGPTHYLSREAGGHLSPSTVPHGPLPGQTGPHGPCRDLTVQLLPLPWRLCCLPSMSSWMARPWPRKQKAPIWLWTTIRIVSFPPSTHPPPPICYEDF